MIFEDFTSEKDGSLEWREILSASYDEWITHVFDHPAEAKGWWWDEGCAKWCVPAATTVNFLTKTFEEPDVLLKRFNLDQVGLGLNYVFSPSCSDIMETLWNESVPWTARQRAIRSICKLCSDCFAAHCNTLRACFENRRGSVFAPKALWRGATKENSHLSKTLGSSLDYVCYMWWHEFRYCAPAEAAHKELDAECLRVMEFALGLESNACLESALHGLGHWVKYHPECAQQARTIIDHFITTNPAASPEIITYARAAMEGKVQ
jgi:hypothetical protein